MTPEERAREFVAGAFGPFGVDQAPYVKIVAELIDGAVDDLRLVAWAAYRELNEIRARDGVPYTHAGGKACVDEEYFSRIVDALEHVLGEDAKPWPAKRWLNQDGSFAFPGQNPGR